MLSAADKKHLTKLLSAGLIGPTAINLIEVKENNMKNQPKRENILFLAPSIEYARTVVKNLSFFLDRNGIPYSAFPEHFAPSVFTDFAYIEFLCDDPITWRSLHFANRDAVFGKKALVEKARVLFGCQYLINTPQMCLDNYLMSLVRKSTECDNPDKPTAYIPGIKKVYFNNPMTIVLWDDDTKTVVKCQEGSQYSKEAGLAWCISKKAFGNKGNFNNIFKKWIPEEEADTVNDIPEAKAADEVVSAIEKMKATAREEVSRLFNNAFKKLPKED